MLGKLVLVQLVQGYLPKPEPPKAPWETSWIENEFSIITILGPKIVQWVGTLPHTWPTQV